MTAIIGIFLVIIISQLTDIKNILREIRDNKDIQNTK